MDGVWIEIGFAAMAVGLLGLAVRELLSLRREQRRSRENDDPDKPD